ncbi:SCP2 sterol-binding domain-containing protein [Asticcacaulis sp. BYS171W]|uniref:SCP2 sterol-binding domain-containing protein n=1 Tax=Asticcacaulis aquaticus TaxID=2984212 RepID=A0ABT5HWI7_9CAUL|nr:SCP2 sterol-binding domain-containing protein [Asticcacaulis aquaticus]MDC7684435.1 SCP2 sterol-binding domain-containing protein [Asticcacaulis aquaticus]
MAQEAGSAHGSFQGLGALQLFGILLSQVPRSLLERLASELETLLALRHPGLSDRLGEAEGRSYRFVLKDFPIDALAKVEKSRLRIGLLDKSAVAGEDVRVSGRLAALFELLQGERDGDALFFTRDIETSGNTEALLVLRNALESEEIDLFELLSVRWRPFHRTVRQGLTLAAGRLDRLILQFDDLFSQKLSPFELALGAQGRRIADIEKRLQRLDRTARKDAEHEAH